MRKLESKRALSPVIATVLLIALVAIIAIIIFIWAASWVGESLRKQNAPIDQKCREVSLDLYYDGSTLEITNNGNVPIYAFDLKLYDGGKVDVERIDDQLSAGSSLNYPVSERYDKIQIIPNLLAEAESSKKVYPCKDNSFEVKL